jgi:hypothetical protein
MRVFRSRGKELWGKQYYRWSVQIPIAMIKQLGWEHRDDLSWTVSGEELRLNRPGQRDRDRDHVLGGRYDPVTGARKPLPRVTDDERSQECVDGR